MIIRTPEYKDFIVGENNGHSRSRGGGRNCRQRPHHKLQLLEKPRANNEESLPDPHGGDEQIYINDEIKNIYPEQLFDPSWAQGFDGQDSRLRVNLNEVERALLRTFLRSKKQEWPHGTEKKEKNILIK